jgi:hypothetical protein
MIASKLTQADLLMVDGRAMAIPAEGASRQTFIGLSISTSVVRLAMEAQQ